MKTKLTPIIFVLVIITSNVNAAMHWKWDTPFHLRLYADSADSSMFPYCEEYTIRGDIDGLKIHEALIPESIDCQFFKIADDELHLSVMSNCLKSGDIALNIDINGFPNYHIYKRNETELNAVLLNGWVNSSINGPYIIAPGETINLSVNSDSNTEVNETWTIDWKTIDTTNITYEYLTQELGLSNGVYHVGVEMWNDYEPGYDSTTITIVPEPTTLAILGLGAIGILRRKTT